MLESISNQNHLEQKIKDNDLFLVIFFKTDSSVSMESLRVLEQMKEENPDLEICSVDVGTVKEIHSEYQVSGVPTVLVFRHGKPAEKIQGKQTLAYYTKLLRTFKTESSSQGRSSNRVTVYTSPTCRYCTAVKSYLKEKSIAFKEVDVSVDQAAAQSLVAKTGQQGVPQIDINGNWIVGFDRPKIDKLLNL